MISHKWHQIDEITVSLRGRTFTFKTDRGVFSATVGFWQPVADQAVTEAEKSQTGELLDLIVVTGRSALS